MSLDDLSLTSASFSSEAGGVLNFFAYFFVSRQKSMWGLGQSPIYRIIKHNQVFSIKNKVEQHE
ncbi:MAG: hypothetical protein AUK44_03730 [Porphyromonadaceae bacterium CG2_30_38_12]|nr:MAG: hypothetical protein AUK44_03730 [Porphyromonadaceae bacterium CG2_30_38_12]